MFGFARAAIVTFCAAAFSLAAQAQTLIVEKKTFTLPSYTTVAGATIKDVKIGWEAAGTLNADKSNAILITHFFSATSHAFGKYAESDQAPGYWDAIVGPGKAIDTNKYYVISSDTLVNLNVNAPNVVTTGPASVNPDTGKPYGMSFPVVSIKDFVNVQKALVESLGIKKLKAVAGASMGALQAYEWAASYPDMVERIVAVIGTPGADPYPHRLARHLGAADPPRSQVEQRRLLRQGSAARWTEGGAEDRHGARQSLAMGGKDLRPCAGRGGQGPSQGVRQPLQDRGGAGRQPPPRVRRPPTPITSSIWSRPINSPRPIRPRSNCRSLVIYTPTDLVFFAPLVEEAAKKMAAAGSTVDTERLAGPNGHLNGVFANFRRGPKNQGVPAIGVATP